MRVEGEKIAARRKASRAGSLPMRFSSSGRKLSYPGGLSSTGTYGPEEGFWPGRGDVLREEFHIPSYEKPKPKIGRTRGFIPFLIYTSARQLMISRSTFDTDGFSGKKSSCSLPLMTNFPIQISICLS